jgi:hypothetical protein
MDVASWWRERKEAALRRRKEAAFDASWENLREACARRKELGAHPRPWRSREESQMIRRFVFQWLTCRDRNRPSGRAWARNLGISHTWLQKLVRGFEADPNKMRLLHAYGDPTLAQLSRAQDSTRRMRGRGELRLSRRIH